MPCLRRREHETHRNGKTVDGNYYQVVRSSVLLENEHLSIEVERKEHESDSADQV